MKKTLFWDYDGVIADSWEIVFTLWKKILHDRGVELTEGMARSAFNEFAWQNLQKLGAGPEDKHLYSAQEVEAYKNPNTAPSLFPGISEIITQCAQKYQMVIVTNNQTEVVIKDVARHGLQDLFLEVQGREFPGDKSDRIKVLCEKYNFNIESSCFITDTVGDIIEAQKVGMDVIAVTWGVHSEEHLRTQKPNQICTDTKQLKQFLL